MLRSTRALRLLVTLVAVPALLIAPAATTVAAATDASIGGRLTFTTGEVAVQMSVDLFSQNRAVYLGSTRTNGNGEYSFPVAAGCYVVTFIAFTGTSFDTGKYKDAQACVTSGQTLTSLDGVNDGPAMVRPTGIGGKVTTILGSVPDLLIVDVFAADANGTRLAYLFTNGWFAQEEFFVGLPDQAGCYVIVIQGAVGTTFTNGTRWSQHSDCVGQGEESRWITATLNGGTSARTGVSGVVTRAGGGTPPPVTIDLFDNGQYTESVTTNAQNAYKFYIPQPASIYSLVFIAPNGYTFTNGSPWFRVDDIVLSLHEELVLPDVQLA